MMIKGKITPTGVLALICALVIAYVLNHVVGVFEPAISARSIEMATTATRGITSSFVAHPLPYPTPWALAGALIGVGGVFCVSRYQAWMSRTYKMRGREHGSAKWLTERDLAPFADTADRRNNILLAQGVSKRLTGRAKSREFDKNNNVLVVGGSGSGKSFYYVLSNLLQANSSYFLSDPKGSTVNKASHYLMRQGYAIKVFNTVNFKKSAHYNPLSYIRSQADIMRFCNMFMDVTSGRRDTGDPFWPKAEQLVIRACVAFMWEVLPPWERTFSTLIDMVDMADVREDMPTYKSPLDCMFEILAEEVEEKKAIGTFPSDYSSYAVRQYEKFRAGAGKTLQSVLISVGARLAPFDLDAIRELMSYDELELDRMGRQKSFLGVIMSDTDDTYGFLIAMLEYQLINLSCTIADDECAGGMLPYPLQLIFDEFRNIGHIPKFDIAISTIRSRNISATMLVQSLAQIYDLYKDAADTIIDCCDVLVYLSGGRSKKTTESLSQYMGKATIQHRQLTENKGQGSTSVAHQGLGRDLLDPAEIAKIRKGESLVIIAGMNPVRAKTLDPMRHPAWKECGYASGEAREFVYEHTGNTGKGHPHAA